MKIILPFLNAFAILFLFKLLRHTEEINGKPDFMRKQREPCSVCLFLNSLQTFRIDSAARTIGNMLKVTLKAMRKIGFKIKQAGKLFIENLPDKWMGKWKEYWRFSGRKYTESIRLFCRLTTVCDRSVGGDRLREVGNAENVKEIHSRSTATIDINCPQPVGREFN